MSMSCCTTTANVQLSDDPSGTRSLRQDFLKEVARRFRALRGRIRRKVGYQNDALHLMRDAPGSLVEPSGNADEDRDRFEFVTRQDLVSKFLRWLRGAVREEVLEPVSVDGVRSGGHWTAPYIQAAYGKGWQQATGRLMREQVSVTAEDDIEGVLQLPIARRQLRKLYSRAFENLEGITDDIGRAHRFARDVEAGQVFVNEWFAGGIETPFGGYKESGIGREKGLAALESYTQLKNVCVNISPQD